MLTYFKISFRNLLRYKLNSSLNILSLSLGLTCALLIFLHVQDELSYDQHYPKAARLYRITDQGFGEGARHWAATPPPLATEIQQFMPELEQVGRLIDAQTQVFRYTPRTGAVRQFEGNEGYYADGSIINLFDLAFSQGNPQTALANINTIVVTERLAQKYFGKEDPIGKIMVEEYTKQAFQVTGVIQNRPSNTHLQFDYLLSMPTLNRFMDNELLKNKTWNGFYTYVLRRNTASKQAVENKMADFTASFYDAPGVSREKILASGIFRLQPITDIHLRSKLEKEMSPNSDITYVYVFATSAFLILVIACINFINMATAQSFKRLKEVGVRKVLGARKNQLIGQFIGESVFFTGIAAFLAIIFIRMAIPLYNNLAGKNLPYEQLFTLENLLMLGLLLAVVSFITGLYPAWFVSSFSPTQALKGQKKPGSAVSFVRKGLVVFQFVISVFMIVSTLIIYRQMKFMQEKDLGFDKEQVLAIKLYGDLKEKVLANTLAFKSELQRHAAISAVSLVSRLPGERLGNEPLVIKGLPEAASIRYMWADESLLPTLNIKLVAGRNFFKHTNDSTTAFILNEAAVNVLALKDPVGKQAASGNTTETGPIVGVVKNFNFASLHTAVEPLVIQYKPAWAEYLLLKIKGNNLPETLSFLKEKINTTAPNSLFVFSFLDDNLNALYQSESRMSNIFKAFAVFTIVISCLGLFGLSAYSAEQRTKEIGIRKVLGASLTSIVSLLSKDFLKLVSLANILAWPLAWWAMHKWLQDFEYRTEISWWLFALAGIAALLIALITVSFQAIKAAVANPVKSLRSE